MKSIRATICQYDMQTDKKIKEYTGTFNMIFRKIPNFKNYYYRFKIFENTSRVKVTDIHFGVQVSDFGSLTISEGDYMNKRLNYCIQNWVDENDKPINANGIFNNLAYWHFTYDNYVTKLCYLDKNIFKKEIDNFLLENPFFVQITDLNSLKGISGIYLMILDNYNNCYIGQSNDMKRRIQRHWSRKDYLSGHGIDLYKAKDTTRIFAFPTVEDLDGKEKIFIQEFKYDTINSLPGGKNISFQEIANHFKLHKSNRLTINDINMLIDSNPDLFVLK